MYIIYEHVRREVTLEYKFIMAGYTMQRKITGFHQDEHGDWVAELECGHGHHVRHDPPFQERAWVLTPDGRAGFIGVPLPCKLCSEEHAASNETVGRKARTGFEKGAPQ